MGDPGNDTRISAWEERERPQYIEVTGDKVYFPAIRFEFEVLEYLKGESGADTIWGLVYLFYGEANTRQGGLRGVLILRGTPRHALGRQGGDCISGWSIAGDDT